MSLLMVVEESFAFEIVDHNSLADVHETLTTLTAIKTIGLPRVKISMPTIVATARYLLVQVNVSLGDR